MGESQNNILENIKSGNYSRNSRRAATNALKSGVNQQDLVDFILNKKEDSYLKKIIGGGAWRNSKVQNLVEYYNDWANENKRAKFSYSSAIGDGKDFFDSVRKFLKDNPFTKASADNSTGTTSQTPADNSTGTSLNDEKKRLLQEANNEIMNGVDESLEKQYKEDNSKINRDIARDIALENKMINNYVNRKLDKITVPEVKKITPGMDNLLALDRKGRRSLRRGEYTRLNNGTAVQAKTRREGRQLARAVNRQRRANNRADKRQGTLDSFLAGYARKGGKLTLMDIYMNNK